MDEPVFICDKCGCGFALSESDRWICDGDALTVCPNCGSADMEEGKRCKICREIHYPWKLRHGVCEACFADAVNSYRHLLDDLQPWEREVLEDEYGTIDITERDE
jgi:hypothetical protein